MYTIMIVCYTSFQYSGHVIYIPLKCFVVQEYLLSNCDYRIAIALGGRDHGQNGPIGAAED